MKVPIEYETNVNRDTGEIFPLHCATSRGYTSIVKSLLKNGAAVNEIDEFGNTPLLIASYSNFDDIKIAKILLDNGANIDVQDEYSLTPLHSAISNGFTCVAKLLIDYKADVNVQDHSGQTPLHYASFRFDSAIIRLILQNGADVNEKDYDGNTPLNILASFRHYSKNCDVNWDNIVHMSAMSGAIHSLIENGADVNAANKNGETPLHKIAYWPSIDEKNVELLIKYGADINAKDIKGRTPLYNAVKRKQPKTVKVLLNAGADVNATTKHGKTAFALVMKKLAMKKTATLSRRSSEILKLICHHEVLLKVAGLNVSGKNIQAIINIRDKLIRDIVRPAYFKEKLNFYELECGLELKRMKSHLKSNSSHKYILTTDSPRYVRNKALMQQLESIDYNEFPIYGKLLKRKYEMDKEKLKLLDKGIQALRILSRRDKRIAQQAIPSELFEKILCQVRNSDMRNLILCAELK